MGAYSRIKRRFWHDEAVQDLSPTAKLLFAYLLTCPHGNVLGCFVLRRGYATEDMGVDPETFDRDLEELVRRGLVEYDPNTHLVLIPRYLKHNPITHGNQARGAVKVLDELPTSPLLERLLASVEALQKDFLEDLAEALRQRLGIDSAQQPDTGSQDEGSPPVGPPLSKTSGGSVGEPPASQPDGCSPGGSPTPPPSVADEGHVEDATQTERAILGELKRVRGYPFDFARDLALIRELATDFPSINLLEEAKKWRVYKMDKPLKPKSNPRLQFRNWCKIAADRMARDSPRYAEQVPRWHYNDGGGPIPF